MRLRRLAIAAVMAGSAVVLAPTATAATSAGSWHRVGPFLVPQACEVSKQRMVDAGYPVVGCFRLGLELRWYYDYYR